VSWPRAPETDRITWRAEASSRKQFESVIRTALRPSLPHAAETEDHLLAGQLDRSRRIGPIDAGGWPRSCVRPRTMGSTPVTCGARRRRALPIPRCESLHQQLAKRCNLGQLLTLRPRCEQVTRGAKSSAQVPWQTTRKRPLSITDNERREKPAKGVEPLTPALRMRCSAN
jgi:hypothetical protein